MVVATLFCSNSNKLLHPSFFTFFLRVITTSSRNLLIQPTHATSRKLKFSPKFVVLAAIEGSAQSGKSEESIPSWASPDSDKPPPWGRDEPTDISNTSNQTIQIPFYVYLLSSAIIAIAAIVSVFEYVNQKPVFGILNSDSIVYAPLLGFFAFIGIPLSRFHLLASPSNTVFA